MITLQQRRVVHTKRLPMKMKEVEKRLYNNPLNSQSVERPLDGHREGLYLQFAPA